MVDTMTAISNDDGTRKDKRGAHGLWADEEVV